MAWPSDWITKTSKDLHRIGESLVSISRQLHEYTSKLEIAVEGRYASEAGDPRVRLLSEALSVSRIADLELGRISEKLTRITQDWHNQSTHEQAQDLEETQKIRPLRSNRGAQGNGQVQAEGQARGGGQAQGTVPTVSPSLQRERDELATLYEITRVLNSTHEFDEVLRLVMDRVIRFVNAERGFLVLINSETEETEFTIARDKASQPIAKEEFTTISQTTVKRVISTSQPVLVNNAPADRKGDESIVIKHIHSLMCAPLLVRNRCIGAVYVDSRFTPTLFESRHLNLLLAFCNQAAIAIENARLFADLSKALKSAKEEKQYIDNIFGSIVNGVVTTNSAGIITTFNAAASFILSLPREQVQGQYYRDAFKSLPQVGLVPMLDKAYAEHEHGTLVNETIECTIPGRDGKVSLNCYVSSLRDTQNVHIGMALVIDDQTSIWQGQRERERLEEQAKSLRRIFEQYVHPSVVEQLIENPQALNLGGETKEISVVFADIRSYTRLSESMYSHEVMNLINRYLKIMCDAIWEEKGTLTAFQGDALMAIFNAPLRQSQHALHAVRAAWKMRMAVLDYQSKLPKEAHISFGFGVNTGMATVGNVGAKGRLQNYTAIGDVVNVASRLQSNATDNDIYINNDTTYTQVYGYVQVGLPLRLEVKNKKGPLTVRRLLGLV